ncbi:MAG: diadenylate cyclase CdaA [Myxococcota bacterium]
MIERLWELLNEFGVYLEANFDPIRDTVDILLVTFGIYWLLLLIRGTRAVQILVGLIALFAASVASEVFQLVTLRLILEYFLSSAVLIFIVIFQNDIRRALAQVGRGFFRPASAREESQRVEEVVRGVQALAEKRTGALVVMERETALEDQIEAGTKIDAELTKELLISIFQARSPLHDGAVLIRDARIAAAGCILPLTLRNDLPEGVGTRHRAAVGITEETDALVIVVSEETGGISVVMSGDMLSDLTPSRLRNLLRTVLSGERRDLPSLAETSEEAEPAEGPQSPSDRARLRWGR